MYPPLSGNYINSGATEESPFFLVRFYSSIPASVSAPDLDLLLLFPHPSIDLSPFAWINHPACL